MKGCQNPSPRATEYWRVVLAFEFCPNSTAALQSLLNQSPPSIDPSRKGSEAIPLHHPQTGMDLRGFRSLFLHQTRAMRVRDELFSIHPLFTIIYVD